MSEEIRDVGFDSDVWNQANIHHPAAINPNVYCILLYINLQLKIVLKLMYF